MRHGYRTQDFYRATNEEQKMLYGAGVPYDFWENSECNFSWKNITDGARLNVSPEKQSKWWNQLTGNPSVFFKNYLVAIGSEPDDHSAREACYHLLKKALWCGHRIQVTPFDDTKEVLREETVFLLDGLFDEIDGSLIGKLRGWLLKHQDCFVALPVGGNVLRFIDRCRIAPDAILQIGATRSFDLDFA